MMIAGCLQGIRQECILLAIKARRLWVCSNPFSNLSMKFLSSLSYSVLRLFGYYRISNMFSTIVPYHLLCFGAISGWI